MKPGAPGGRGRTWAPVDPSCPLCWDRKLVRLVFAEVSGLPEIVECPHCMNPHIPISNYYKQG
jgi:hypothetical protein